MEKPEIPLQAAAPQLDTAEYFRLLQACADSSGGVFTRIDQNREIMALIREKTPELLVCCPWIESWLQAHDLFFLDLANALRLPPPQMPDNPFHLFPRPWPGNPVRWW